MLHSFEAQRATSRRATSWLALLMLCLGYSYAQQRSAASKDTISNRVALRVAREILISDLFRQTQAIVIDDDPDLPADRIDLKVALIAFHLSHGVGSVNQELLQNRVQLLSSFTTVTVQGQSVLNRSSDYLDKRLKDRATRQAKYLSTVDERERAELRLNELVTPAAAATIKQSAGKLWSLRSKETLLVLEQTRIAMAEILTRHPEYLEPFLKERPASEALQASRARLQGLLLATGAAR